MAFPEATQEQINDGKGIGILSYFWWLVIVPLLAKKDNPFTMYHARQGLALAILQTIIFILRIVFGRFATWYGIGVLFGIFSIVFWLLFVLLWIFAIIGIIKCAQGKFWKLPLVGDLAESLFKDMVK